MFSWIGKRFSTRSIKKRLIEALTRLSVPNKVIANIEALYKDPKFKVECKDSESNYMSQEAGIRQGCPLSPYLFLFVMTVMFADIHNRQTGTLLHGFIDGIDFSEILYADDTICMSEDEETMNRILKDIEKEGATYGLKLNKTKM